VGRYHLCSSLCQGRGSKIEAVVKKNPHERKGENVISNCGGGAPEDKHIGPLREARRSGEERWGGEGKNRKNITKEPLKERDGRSSNAKPALIFRKSFRKRA